MKGALEPLLLLAGAALIAFGAGMVYRPAGAIVGGVLLLAGLFLRARGAQ